MTDEEILKSNNWRWVGMGYRSNGDGYGRFREIEGNYKSARVGGYEVAWNGKSSFKQCCIKAMVRRIDNCLTK